MPTKKIDTLISSYEVRLVEPGCTPGVGRWGAQVSIDGDISPVFPYLNATWNNAWYDHENKILIWGDENQRYAFRPGEIRIARVQDPLDARQVANQIVERVNSVWQQRDRITPRFTEKRLPAAIDIFKLLPRTNCRQCGQLTCLAFAAELRQGVVHIDDCPHLSGPDYAANRDKIVALFVTD